MDLKADIFDALQIPVEKLEICRQHAAIATVPTKWLEKLRSCQCNSDLSVDKEIWKTFNKESMTNYMPDDWINLVISVLNCTELGMDIVKDAEKSEVPHKLFDKSFIGTFSIIAEENKNGLFKDLVRSSEQCYCVEEEKDLDFKSENKTKIEHCCEVISRIHGVRLLDFTKNESNGSKFDNVDSRFANDSHLSMSNDETSHTNLKRAIFAVLKNSKIFLINNDMNFTVKDALMYSPALLPSESIKTLFILYQTNQFFHHFQENCNLDLSLLHWGNVELDTRLWVKVYLTEKVFLKTQDGSKDESFKNKSNSSSQTQNSARKAQDNNVNNDSHSAEMKETVNEHPDQNQLFDLLDKWICGELSNFDYLMFLNKLSGRSGKDPNHHPVLPWVSNFDFDDGESWRDLTKSKYRLNKGDRQLDIQYTMMRDSADEKDTKSRFRAPNLPQVPHHVPEFLSDITYYVYMARRTSKDILCKLVRSYWEPNEYPASIQRMQVWTPDECIPEFYTDPTVFKSIHEDMTDLAVPKWCRDAEEFVKKHRAMLESEQVSLQLHYWIDVTFGYKLSGADAVEAKNVCLPLVDNHTKQTNRGIVQLFNAPHPKRRCRIQAPEPPFKINVVDDESLIDFPPSYDPLKELDELEKLLKFKAKTWKRTDSTNTLSNALESSRNSFASRGQHRTILSDRNVVTLICLMIELYLPQEVRTMNKEVSLDERFKMCIQCYKLHKSRLSSGINFAIQYFLTNFRNSEEETYLQLAKTSNSSHCVTNYASIFKTVSDRGLPPPTPALLLSSYAHILPFPPYFEDLYELMDIILMNTDHYNKPLSDQILSIVTRKLYELFEKLHDARECLLILTPHIQRLLCQPTVPAVKFLLHNFETLSKAMGSKATCNEIFPHILVLYEASINKHTERKEDNLSSEPEVLSESDISKSFPNDETGSDDAQAGTEDIETVSWLSDEVEEINLKTKIRKPENQSSDTESNNDEFDTTILAELYKESFLLQLNTRLGLKVFIENLPRCLADAVVSSEFSISVTAKQSICWLMQRIGPTLTSKYIVRHLFRVLSRCFLFSEGSKPSNSDCHKPVLDCLIHAASLFGPSMLTLQYFAHLIHNISSAAHHPKYAPRHQAAVEASVAAVTHFITFLTDTSLMEQLKRLSKEIICPILDLLARTDVSFYGGAEARKSLCLKVIHMMALLLIRIGREMSRQHLTPLFQTFFSHFSHQQISSSEVSHPGVKSQQLNRSFDSVDSDAVIIHHDIDTRTFKVGNTVLQESSSGMRRQLHKSWFNYSPTPSPNKGIQESRSFDNENAIDNLQEIWATFCPETAYCSYISFTRFLGNIYMEKILGKDYDHIWKLSSQHEKSMNGESGRLMSTSQSYSAQSSYTSDITMVGNKLIVASETPQIETKSNLESDDDIMTTLLTSSGGMNAEGKLEGSARRNLQEFPSSQLTENWLAYWEHEIGLPENDRHIHFNQIELQPFGGHSGAVRCLSCHPSEEWFASGGKDKLVKLWSLWNNNTTTGGKKDKQPSTTNSSFIYKSHKKTINYVGIVESEQYILSCDGSMHVWDPYTGQQVNVYDSTDVKSGFALAATLPAPQRYALAITNEANVRFIDFRRKILAHEFKTVAGNSVGIARAMCTTNDGQWVAIGFSTGVISILDVRKGLLSMRQGHDADISTMASVSEKQFLTASADQTVSLWEVQGKPQPIFIYKTYQEPIHVIQTFNDEIIAGSVANRITVHRLPAESGNSGMNDPKQISEPRAMSKFRSDSFKGVLTSFSVLPMKRQLLVASDNGNIKLMA
ncbi:WD repeat-containing protein 81-like [Styela clava]